MCWISVSTADTGMDGEQIKLLTTTNCSSSCAHLSSPSLLQKISACYLTTEVSLTEHVCKVLYVTSCLPLPLKFWDEKHVQPSPVKQQDFLTAEHSTQSLEFAFVQFNRHFISFYHLLNQQSLYFVLRHLYQEWDDCSCLELFLYLPLCFLGLWTSFNANTMWIFFSISL